MQTLYKKEYLGKLKVYAGEKAMTLKEPEASSTYNYSKHQTQPDS